MNVALRQFPINFDVQTPLGFRILGNTNDLIQRHIYLFGVWEPDATAAVRRLLKPGSTVVDVGANIGYFSLLAAISVGQQGSVHAIEALPSTRRLLRRNLASNQMSNIRVHAVAASDREGLVEMFRARPAFIGSSSTKAGAVSEGAVPSARLDDLLAEVEPGRVTLLKVDVEGDEAAVLRGATKLLSGMPAGAAALVELAPPDEVAAGDDAAAVLELMSNYGFVAYALSNDYSVKRYADPRTKPPEPLLETPTGWADVLFVKEH